MQPVDAWVQLVGTVGFPIAVGVYVLVRLHRTLRELRDCIQALTRQLERER